jgi:prepilin peptidase CpaA
MTTLEGAGAALAVAAVGLLAYVALNDFKVKRIANGSVLLLVGVGAALAAIGGWSVLASGFGAGFALLALGFVAWMAKVFGAGDAKLLFACGLLVRFEGLLDFALYMVAATLGFVMALAVVSRATALLPPALVVHTQGIVRSRRIPAAVPIATAAAIVIWRAHVAVI